MLTEASRPIRRAATLAFDDDGNATIEPRGVARRITVDPVTATVWKLLDGTVTLADIADDLVAILGGSRSDRYAQLHEMILRLMNESLVDIGNGYVPFFPASEPTWPLPVMEKDEPLYDHMLHPYDPVVPVEGMLQSVNLLLAAAPTEQAAISMRRLVDALRAEFGRSRFVWAIKVSNGVPSWEIYLYRCGFPQVLTFEQMRGALAAHMPWGVTWSPPDNYSLISVELAFDDDGHFAPVDAIDAYWDLPGYSTCYHVNDNQLFFKNAYSRYSLPADHDLFEARLAAGPYLGRSIDFVGEKIEKYGSTATLAVVASKPRAEGIYAGQVKFAEAASFFEDQGFPTTVTDFVNAHEDRLGHLRFDLGFDFAVDRNGDLAVVKAIVFGVL